MVFWEAGEVAPILRHHTRYNTLASVNPLCVNLVPLGMKYLEQQQRFFVSLFLSVVLFTRQRFFKHACYFAHYK